MRVHEDDHRERHRVGQVHVAGRRRQVLRVVAGGDHLEPVAEQDEEEQRHRERHDPTPLLADPGVDLARDGVRQGLEDELHPAGHAGRYVEADSETDSDHEQPRDEGGEDVVGVDGQAEHFGGRFDADRDRLGSEQSGAGHVTAPWRSKVATRLRTKRK